MLTLGTTITAVAGLAILVIGVSYLTKPRAMGAAFGLPALPGTEATSWLRVKGVRDSATGIAAFVLLLTASPHTVGWTLLAFCLIPTGDALTVWFSGGSRRTALAIHASTAALMIVGAIALLIT